MAQQELNGDGRPENKPGVYKHPESGHELIARRHRKFGDAQADGFVQAGYRYVGPAPKEAVVPKTPKAEKLEAVTPVATPELTKLEALDLKAPKPEVKPSTKTK